MVEGWCMQMQVYAGPGRFFLFFWCFGALWCILLGRGFSGPSLFFRGCMAGGLLTWLALILVALPAPNTLNQVNLELDTLGTAVQTGRWRTLDSVVLEPPHWYFGYVIPTGTVTIATASWTVPPEAPVRSTGQARP